MNPKPGSSRRKTRYHAAPIRRPASSTAISAASPSPGRPQRCAGQRVLHRWEVVAVPGGTPPQEASRGGTAGPPALLAERLSSLNSCSHSIRRVALCQESDGMPAAEHRRPRKKTAKLGRRRGPRLPPGLCGEHRHHFELGRDRGALAESPEPPAQVLVGAQIDARAPFRPDDPGHVRDVGVAEPRADEIPTPRERSIQLRELSLESFGRLSFSRQGGSERGRSRDSRAHRRG